MSFWYHSWGLYETYEGVLHARVVVTGWREQHPDLMGWKEEIATLFNGLDLSGKEAKMQLRYAKMIGYHLRESINSIEDLSGFVSKALEAFSTLNDLRGMLS